MRIDYAFVHTEHSSSTRRVGRPPAGQPMLAPLLRRDEAALVGFLEGAPGKITTLTGATAG